MHRPSHAELFEGGEFVTKLEETLLAELEDLNVVWKVILILLLFFIIVPLLFSFGAIWTVTLQLERGRDVQQDVKISEPALLSQLAQSDF